MSDGGKGSAQRPRNISQNEWESRWDAIFQRDQIYEAKAEYIIDEVCPKCKTKLEVAAGIGPFCPNLGCDVKDNISLV